MVLSTSRLILLMAEILHQLIGSLSHYLQGFIHPRWCKISAINSINSSQSQHFLNFQRLPPVDFLNLMVIFAQQTTVDPNPGNRLDPFGAEIERKVDSKHYSGQFITTSADLTPNGGLVREVTLFQGNLGWWNIIICPDWFHWEVVRFLFFGNLWTCVLSTEHSTAQKYMDVQCKYDSFGQC